MPESSAAFEVFRLGFCHSNWWAGAAPPHMLGPPQVSFLKLCELCSAKTDRKQLEGGGEGEV